MTACLRWLFGVLWKDWLGSVVSFVEPCEMLDYLTIFPGHFNLDIVQSRAGVHKSTTSGYESFEAPDPAEWTARGYAVVNVNARGIMGSTGDTR